MARSGISMLRIVDASSPRASSWSAKSWTSARRISDTRRRALHALAW
jgi:hypothetical protein